MHFINEQGMRIDLPEFIKVPAKTLKRKPAPEESAFTELMDWRERMRFIAAKSPSFREQFAGVFAAIDKMAGG